MRDEKPIATVIIPTYHDWGRLALCLQALGRQTYPQEKFEVIIVNNAPGDTCPYELPASNMVIIEEPKPGSYAARNTGIRTAKGRILAFTDSDCKPRNNWLAEGVKFLLTPQDKQCIGVGRVELFYRRPDKLTPAEIYEKMFGFPYQKAGRLKKLNSLVTANVFMFRQTFTEVGLFEERLMSGGDGSFGKRALSRNYQLLYNPACVVDHPARYSLTELIEKRKRILGGHISITIHMRKQKRTSAVIVALFNQWKKSLRQSAWAVGTKHLENTADRARLLSAIIALLMALTGEGLAVLLTGKVKR